MTAPILPKNHPNYATNGMDARAELYSLIFSWCSSPSEFHGAVCAERAGRRASWCFFMDAAKCVYGHLGVRSPRSIQHRRRSMSAECYMRLVSAISRCACACAKDDERELGARAAFQVGLIVGHRQLQMAWNAGLFHVLAATMEAALRHPRPRYSAWEFEEAGAWALGSFAVHAKHAESENYVVGPPDSHDVGTFAFCGDGGDQMGFVDELQASCDGLDVAAASRLREALAKAIDLLTRANEDDFESGLDSPES